MPAPAGAIRADVEVRPPKAALLLRRRSSFLPFPGLLCYLTSSPVTLMAPEQKNFYVAGGTLHPEAASYVERQADADLCRYLQAGEICYVLTSRQMGKSSLMVRTVQRLRGEGTRVAVLDLTAIGQNLTVDQWYDGLMAHLGRQLNLEEPLLEFWTTHERWGPLQRWLTAVETILLPSFPSNLVIFVDEIDIVRSLPFSTDEFFAGIRECFNRRCRDPNFSRLTFCLLGVATPADLIKDNRVTPFNIGRRIELHDFTEKETAALAEGLCRANGKTPAADPGAVMRRILYWTGGHPYLTQSLCRDVGESADDPRTTQTVDRTCEELFTSLRARERDDNLIFVREWLLNRKADRARLLDVYDQVRRGKRVRDDETQPLISALKLSGIVCGENGRLRVRNRIYAKVFDKQWIRANLPEAEQRRQRSAFRRGLVFAGSAGLVLIALLIFAATYQPRGELRTLPDRSTVTLGRVAFDKNLHYQPPFLRRSELVEKIPWLQRIFPPRPGGLSAQYPNQVCLVEIIRRDFSGGAPMLRGVVIDNVGNKNEASGTGYSTSSEKEVVMAWIFRSFPRRQKSFVLRVYQADASGGGWQKLADFTLKNPNPGPYPVWKPENAEATPATTPRPLAIRTAGDLEFRLTGLISGVSRNLAQPAAPAEEQWTLATFQILRESKPAEDWQPAFLVASDATGNEWVPSATQISPNQFAFKGALFTGESAVKLRVKFSSIPADRFWSLPNCLIPPPGGMTRGSEKTSRHGATIEWLGLAGANAFVPGSVAQRFDFPTAHLRVSPAREDLEVSLFRATDETGSEVTRPLSLEGIPLGPASIFCFGLAPAAAATIVNLTFSLAEQKSIEFLAKPQQARN